MKKGFILLLMAFAMLFCAQPVYAAVTANPTVTIAYQPNGGQGTMANQALSTGTPAVLTPNAFTRDGFLFNGWNDEADGSGTAYADQASVAQLFTDSNYGKTITLYAQWKLPAPKISKLKKESPVTVKVKFSKVKNSGGYEIEYSTNKNFKKAQTVTAKKNVSSVELTNTIPGKTHYVRIRSFFKSGKNKIYSDWSASKKIKLKKVSSISNIKSEATIEADVTLTGSGTGYHAKLVICTPNSAVSFGLQYDSCAVAPYTGKTMALIENVAHNGPGGQQYTRPGNKSLKLGKKYHLMLTIDKSGKGAVYLDYKKIGSFKNSGLAKQVLYLRVEGSARLNGDKVNAKFENIKCKSGGKYDPSKVWGRHEFQTCKTIKAKGKKDGSILISGTISGLPAGGDWDNCYGDVSNIIQFVQ